MSPNQAATKRQFAADLGRCALAFRGYNITNLGRSRELLAHPAYGPVVKRYLRQASAICAETVGKNVDLVGRVRRGREASLRCYAEAIALVMAMELAQLHLLRDFHGIDAHHARLAFGYSLGEPTAVTYGGMFEMAELLPIPLSVARDCADLARDVTMGILFSRGPALVEDDVVRLCLKINTQRDGVLGISAVLSPNSLLLVGQRNTVVRFGQIMHETLDPAVHLRLNPHRWPPLHTPVIWQRHVPNRAAILFQQITVHQPAPCPDVVSLVSTADRYTDLTARDVLHRWIDHPQRLWDAVCAVLAAGVETVVHVGPEPNLIPATFKRLSNNVRQQASSRSFGSLGLRAVSGMVRRPWLAALLPSRTSLLRAPEIKHVILEDWLLDEATA